MSSAVHVPGQRCPVCGRPLEDVAYRHDACVRRLVQANNTYSSQFASFHERERALIGMQRRAQSIMRSLLVARAVIFAGSAPVKRVFS